jgi:NAD(P)-dependent dehydrogenase (short-subunit alcohol dehydrogenase family)
MSSKVVMITGAAGNLGQAAATVFEGTGARLLLVDRDAEALRQRYPGSAAERVLLGADLMDGSSWKEAFDKAADELGRIDVLCNIAGGFHYGEPVHRTPMDVWQRMIDLNATTLINAVAAVVPRMIAAGSGAIFNVGAAGHLHGRANMGPYAAGKSAVMRLTESMAEELGGTGVSVFCLMPNVIDTPQNRAAMPDADTSTWTTPLAIANLMALLTQEAAALMSGSLIPLMGSGSSGQRAAASASR